MALHIRAHIDENGNLSARLPVPYPAGDVTVIIEPNEDFLAQFQNLPAGEIQTGGWKQLGIEDSAAWAEANRRAAESRN